MLKRTIFALLLSLMVVTSAAAEGTGIYASAKFIDSYQTNYGGGFLSGSNSDNTFGAAFALGYDFYANSDTSLRTEVEYAFRSEFNSEDSASFYGATYSTETSINVHTIMANVYYDFYNESAFTPYVGGGLGVGFLDGDFETNGVHVGSTKIQNTVFAFNLGAGVGYNINESLTADLGYRYLNLGTGDTDYYGNELKTSMSAHEFSLGLRLGF